MSEIFRRVYELIIGNGEEAIRIDGFQETPLQIQFLVDQSPDARVSNAEITVYGLSRETRRKIREKYTQITLIAGYQKNSGVIFEGDIVNSGNGRDGPDQFLRMYCRAGGRPKSISKSWGNNTPRAEIIRDVADAFGYPVEMVGDFSTLPPAANGFSVTPFATLIEVMDDLAEAWSFTWMIQNQRVMVLAEGAVYPNGELFPDDIYKISATTGMVGSPSITLVGVDVKAKLNPSVMPGTVFDVQAETGSFEFNEVYYKKFQETNGLGRYRVKAIRYTGNFYGAEWDMDLEGIRYTQLLGGSRS
ncbi:MAG: hypothetical protein P1U64_04015 [Alcanivoracaceae bacterium]|nr:hypothetical protein [Alcanivoracaceae bacterium]